MKKIIALFLACIILLTGCFPSDNSNTSASREIELPTNSATENSSQEDSENLTSLSTDDISFTSLSDPELLQHIRDTVHSDLEYRFHSDDFIVQNVDAIYISKEYIEELEYNSKENIFFGFTLSELQEQFQGTKYIFTLGDNNETIVQAFEGYDDTFEQVLKNVAIGSGIILVCVTVSVISAAGAPAISMVFAASAKTGTITALTDGALSALAAGVVDGFQNRDVKSAFKVAALEGSKGFKWGAIVGTISGGISKTLELRTIRTPQQSEAQALKVYGGEAQKTYLNGKEVPYGTPGATRPDITKNVDGVSEFIEVKNYNLKSKKNQQNLYTELKRQIKERVENLPEGSKQRVVLDIRGRGYSKELLKEVVNNIQNRCNEFYPNLPVDLLTY